jgi:hypothetical protein
MEAAKDAQDVRKSEGAAALAFRLRMNVEAARTARARETRDGSPELGFVSACVTALATLSPSALQVMNVESARLALHDAAELGRLLESSSLGADTLAENLVLACLLAERLARQLGVLVLEPTRTADAGPKDAQTERPGDLSCHAYAYGEDARRNRASTWLLVALAVALLSGALALSLLGIRAAGGRNFDFAEFGAYGLIAIGVLAAAGVAARAASKSALVARESKRLERQMASLDAYLEPLPKQQRDLARGVMLPQMFPRLLEDDDPLRAPDWPDAATLLSAGANAESPGRGPVPDDQEGSESS